MRRHPFIAGFVTGVSLFGALYGAALLKVLHEEDLTMGAVWTAAQENARARREAADAES